MANKTRRQQALEMAVKIAEKHSGVSIREMRMKTGRGGSAKIADGCTLVVAMLHDGGECAEVIAEGLNCSRSMVYYYRERVQSMKQRKITRLMVEDALEEWQAFLNELDPLIPLRGLRKYDKGRTEGKTWAKSE